MARLGAELGGIRSESTQETLIGVIVGSKFGGDWAEGRAQSFYGNSVDELPCTLCKRNLLNEIIYQRILPKGVFACVAILEKTKLVINKFVDGVYGQMHL